MSPLAAFRWVSSVPLAGLGCRDASAGVLLHVQEAVEELPQGQTRRDGASSANVPATTTTNATASIHVWVQAKDACGDNSTRRAPTTAHQQLLRRPAQLLLRLRLTLSLRIPPCGGQGRRRTPDRGGDVDVGYVAFARNSMLQDTEKNCRKNSAGRWLKELTQTPRATRHTRVSRVVCRSRPAY